MENNIVCSRCGSANVRCEAMVNPNTKGFDHFTDEAFYYGWCENCGLGVALTDKEEIRNEILEKYHRFKKENACEPHYANCRIVQRDSGQVKDVRSKHSDKYIFYTLRFDCSFAAANTIKPQLL